MTDSEGRQEWRVLLPEALADAAIAETTYTEDGYTSGPLWAEVARQIAYGVLLAVDDGMLVIKINVARAASDALAALTAEDADLL